MPGRVPEGFGLFGPHMKVAARAQNAKVDSDNGEGAQL